MPEPPGSVDPVLVDPEPVDPGSPVEPGSVVAPGSVVPPELGGGVSPDPPEGSVGVLGGGSLCARMVAEKHRANAQKKATKGLRRNSMLTCSGGSSTPPVLRPSSVPNFPR
jgi:hypothetical protein